jgi:hypothetical protein
MVKTWGNNRKKEHKAQRKSSPKRAARSKQRHPDTARMALRAGFPLFPPDAKQPPWPGQTHLIFL